MTRPSLFLRPEFATQRTTRSVTLLSSCRFKWWRVRDSYGAARATARICSTSGGPALRIGGLRCPRSATAATRRNRCRPTGRDRKRDRKRARDDVKTLTPTPTLWQDLQRSAGFSSLRAPSPAHRAAQRTWRESLMPTRFRDGRFDLLALTNDEIQTLDQGPHRPARAAGGA